MVTIVIELPDLEHTQRNMIDVIAAATAAADQLDSYRHRFDIVIATPRRVTTHRHERGVNQPHLATTRYL